MNARIHWLAIAAALIGAALLVSPIRRWLEADMARHMLIEFPLLVAAGYGIAAVLPAQIRTAIVRLDRLGLVSLALASVSLALWMIPVALDATLERPSYAGAKYVSLFATGVLLHGVTARSPLPIQAFFVGSIAWMMATVGLLYQDAPQALCVYYLADMQQRAGFGLVALAIVGGGAWYLFAAGALKGFGLRVAKARPRRDQSSQATRVWRLRSHSRRRPPKSCA